MDKKLSDLDFHQLEEYLALIGEKKFRAGQIYKWVSRGRSIDEMTDQPKALRENLKAEFPVPAAAVIKELNSCDGSSKFLFRLSDGNVVEGVYMPHDYGNTLCISSQVGCRMGCRFCASTLEGLSRNLTSGEMLDFVYTVNRLKEGVNARAVTNIVLMGSGEPLDNYDNVIKFIQCVSDANGINVSRRNISLSTCGLVPEIYLLAGDGGGVTLSVSLHATTDEARRATMPIAAKYSLTELIKAVKAYFDKTGRRIVFEYALMKEVNMNFFDAKRLKELTSGFSAHVNLIMLNQVKERNIEGCTKEQAKRFLDKLVSLGVSATLRKSMGSDIEGACGQLRRKFVLDQSSKNP